MKKLFAIAIAVSLAGSAMAAGSVGFEWGTNFFKPSNAGAQTQNGTNFTLSWNLDNDLSMGVYTETSNLLGGGAVAGDTVTVSAIQIMKGVVKNVAVGLNLGSGTETVGVGSTSTLVDVLGTVNILSGTGEKVTGNLRAMASARFCATTCKMDGVNLGLGVQVLF